MNESIYHHLFQHQISIAIIQICGPTFHVIPQEMLQNSALTIIRRPIGLIAPTMTAPPLSFLPLAIDPRKYRVKSLQY